MWIPALLYEPEKLASRVPVIMNVNGHVGKPGKSVDYKQIRCINQAKRGMLALNVEWIGMGQLSTDGFSHARMNQLDLCGTSGLAPFFLSMKHGLDLLLSLPHADPARVAVTGLSGGGWQTIFISGLDPRVTLANPVAGYSSFLTRTRYAKDLGDSEQTPCDMATVADYTHLTAMRAPHATLLTFNGKDNCCFESGYALQPLLDAARPIFRLFDREAALRWHVNYDPGTHNYELDNRLAFYGMLGDFFCPGQPGFHAELPSDKEVKKFDELVVELPTPNQDFHTLAVALAEHLPRTAAAPTDAAALCAWRAAQLPKLRALLRAKPMSGVAAAAGSQQRGDLQATFRKFSLGGQWTVPAVVLTRGAPSKTALLVADGGRRSTAALAGKLLDQGYRVVAADPLNLGESSIPGKAHLWMLTLATTGQRPLGVQACQVGAIARLLAAEHNQPVTLVSCGPRCGLTALVAAAFEDQAIAHVELHESLASLKEVLAKNWSYAQAPELFCFGLLEQFDIPHLLALAGQQRVSKE
jgi:dienelactone hydrolase